MSSITPLSTRSSAMAQSFSLPEVSSTRIKKYDVFLVVLLIGSLSLNVYLGWTVKRLRRIPANPQNSVKLSPGMIVQPIPAMNLDGKQETITYVGKPTVVYIFSPQCRWCERNTQSINALASFKGDSFRFVGLSLSDDDLAKYLESDRLSFPVYKNPAPDAVRSLGLASTPQTIVISPEGRVLKNWIGAFGEKLQPQVEEYFNVRLPGLAAERN